MRNSWNSSLFLLVVGLAICFAYSTTDNEEHIQSLPNNNFTKNDNMRRTSSSSKISDIGSKFWKGGGGNRGGWWGYGSGWGTGGNGGEGGGWCWNRCGSSSGGGGDCSGGGGGGNGRGEGGEAGGVSGDSLKRYHIHGSKVHRSSYSSRLLQLNCYINCNSLQYPQRVQED